MATALASRLVVGNLGVEVGGVFVTFGVADGSLLVVVSFISRVVVRKVGVALRRVLESGRLGSWKVLPFINSLKVLGIVGWLWVG